LYRRNAIEKGKNTPVTLLKSGTENGKITYQSVYFEVGFWVDYVPLLGPEKVDLFFTIL
jgi:hypothetical protein